MSLVFKVYTPVSDLVLYFIGNKKISAPQPTYSFKFNHQGKIPTTFKREIERDRSPPRETSQSTKQVFWQAGFTESPDSKQQYLKHEAFGFLVESTRARAAFLQLLMLNSLNTPACFDIEHLILRSLWVKVRVVIKASWIKSL
jgi:hypothetical protein